MIYIVTEKVATESMKATVEEGLEVSDRYRNISESLDRNKQEGIRQKMDWCLLAIWT